MTIKNYQFIFFSAGCLLMLLFAVPAKAQKRLIDTAVERARTDAYAKQLETYLRHYLIDEYEARAAKAWNRDYSSIDALKRSVEPNRRRWEEVLSPPDLKKSGPLSKRPYVLDDVQAEWIELP